MKGRLLPVFVFQREQLPEAVPAVAQGLFGGVDTFVDQTGGGVAPGGAAVEAIGVGQQSAFGVAAEAFFGVIGVLDMDQLTGFVEVLGCVARRIGEADHLAEVVVLPNAGFAGAVGVLDKLPGIWCARAIFCLRLNMVNMRAVAGTECNTTIELMQEHYGACPSPL